MLTATTRFRTLFYTLLVLLVVVTSSMASAQGLSVSDFKFDGEHGSAGATIEQLAASTFLVKLGHAPKHPTWPNKLNCYIKKNAKGVALRLIVQFDSGRREYAFNEYFQSYSHNRMDWKPVFWHQNRDTSPKRDTLDFPAFTADSVWIGTQVPFSFEDYKLYQNAITQFKDCSMTVIGFSQQNRPIYRLTFTATNGKIPLTRRWGLYFAVQHPGEHNAHRRMQGMLDFLASDSGKSMLEHTVCHFVFFPSPDAPYHGWYRVVASGEDMNRTFRVQGYDPSQQPKEAHALQKDLQRVFSSEASLNSVWSVHTWPGLVDNSVKGESMLENQVLGDWKKLDKLIQKFDSKDLIKPMYKPKEEAIDPVMWAGGPAKAYGCSAYLCEGGGNIYTEWENKLTGFNIMQALSRYYNKPKPKR